MFFWYFFSYLGYTCALFSVKTRDYWIGSSLRPGDLDDSFFLGRKLSDWIRTSDGPLCLGPPTEWRWQTWLGQKISRRRSSHAEERPICGFWDEICESQIVFPNIGLLQNMTMSPCQGMSCVIPHGLNGYWFWIVAMIWRISLLLVRWVNMLTQF